MTSDQAASCYNSVVAAKYPLGPLISDENDAEKKAIVLPTDTEVESSGSDTEVSNHSESKIFYLIFRQSRPNLMMKKAIDLPCS